MNQEGASGSVDLKKDRSHAQAPAVQDAPSVLANGIAHNGTNGHLPNGISAGDLRDAPATNGAARNESAVEPDPKNPPPLDQSWRQGEQNKSLGKLMERVAQQCYFDLNKTLDEMNATPVEPAQSQMPNGLSPHTGPDTSDKSLSKKRLLMNFANEQRDRFTKTLVLSDWSRNIDDKARLIDVKVWLDKQRNAYEQAEYGIMQTKTNMRGAKVPNPNIEGAMEVLATGKASWLPDMGYIAAKPLSAKKLLDTLRGMNVTLATRLSLHEELPPYFQDYTIADGRATFTVKDEFEVDLSIADEDPATPFYFIDIRLAFEPSAAIVDDRIRAHLEGRINAQLAQNGLKGCYDFLHNFVLTHKLNVLQTQAAELVKSKWFDCIRIESLRRSLIVQYWSGREGPKSWVEISLNSGKQKSPQSRRPPNPYIAVRRFYNGVEMKDGALDFDWKDLSLEKCLLQVIEDHTKRIAQDLQTRITNLAPEKADFKATISAEGHSIRSTALVLVQPFVLQPIRVSIEPVTGQYSITPPSLASLHAERRLNNEPSADAVRWLAALPCAVVQERTRKQAELLGWIVRSDMAAQDNLASIIDEKSIFFSSVFKPRSNWGDKWALIATFSLGRTRWLVAELQQIEGRGKVIIKAQPVRVPEAIRNDHLTLSRDSLINIEKWAVADVALGTLSKQLRSEHVPFKTEQLFAASHGQAAAKTNIPTPQSSMALYIRLSQLMKAPQKQDKNWQAWADEIVKVTHHGVVSNGMVSNGMKSVEKDKEGFVQHDLRLSLTSGKMQDLRKQVDKTEDRDLAMNSTGGLALRFATPFGQPFVSQMRERLQGVERLDQYASVLRERHFVCTHLSLSRLAFTYSRSPQLSAELSSPSDGSARTATLRFYPPDTNPHLRVRVFLEKAFNNTTNRTQAFSALTYILSLSLPLLRTLDKLESKIINARTISIHPRSATWYSITYHSPLPAVRYDIRSKVRHADDERTVRWLLDSFRPTSDGATLPEDLVKAVRELWQEDALGEGVDGIRTGVITGAVGIATVVERLDEVLRKFESEVGSTVKDEGKSGPAQEAGGKQEAPAAAAPTTKKEKIKSEPDVIMLD